MTKANPTSVHEPDLLASSSAKTTEVSLLTAEYSALRQEILYRIQAQTTLSNIAVTLAAGVTGAVFLALNAYKGNGPASYVVIGLLIASAVFGALQLATVEHEFEMICLGQYIEVRLAKRVRQLLGRPAHDIYVGQSSVARQRNKTVVNPVAHAAQSPTLEATPSGQIGHVSRKLVDAIPPALRHRTFRGTKALTGLITSHPATKTLGSSIWQSNEQETHVWDWEVFRRQERIRRLSSKWPPVVPRMLWLPVRTGRYELQLGPAIFSLLGAGAVYAAYSAGMSLGVFSICVILFAFDLILITVGIIYPWYIHSTYQPGRPYK
jgi:hypothetical protein